ncbi:LysM peptidoglycan-binding domain-containing protein [Mycoplasmatota bacterium]|nr:LysM peptidoglycan-binding domain-containing protein [Mycoplasmatota bacterium]
MEEHIHYTVCWGDSFESIANRFGVSSQEIKSTNSIDEIYTGKILIIPNKTEEIPIKKIIINKSLGDYLKRHAKKKHIFNFYSYKKSHQ